MLRPARTKLEEEDFPQEQSRRLPEDASLSSAPSPSTSNKNIINNKQQQQESASRQRRISKRSSKKVLFLTLSSIILLGIAVQVHLATTSTISLDLTTPASIDLIDLKEEEGAVVIDDAKSSANNDYNSTSSSNVTKGSDNNDEDNEDKQQQISVFYNVFTDSVNDIPTVKKMVEEQLSNLRPYHKVFVRSIGVPLKIENTTLLQHDEKGWEPETLRLLWQHCKNHTNDKVVYIHSKGSFHPNNDNDLLRRFLAQGAFLVSEECSNLPSSCNACSS